MDVDVASSTDMSATISSFASYKVPSIPTSTGPYKEPSAVPFKDASTFPSTERPDTSQPSKSKEEREALAFQIDLTLGENNPFNISRKDLRLLPYPRYIPNNPLRSAVHRISACVSNGDLVPRIHMVKDEPAFCLVYEQSLDNIPETHRFICVPIPYLRKNTIRAEYVDAPHDYHFPTQAFPRNITSNINHLYGSKGFVSSTQSTKSNINTALSAVDERSALLLRLISFHRISLLKKCRAVNVRMNQNARWLARRIDHKKRYLDAKDNLLHFVDVSFLPRDLASLVGLATCPDPLLFSLPEYLSGENSVPVHYFTLPQTDSRLTLIFDDIYLTSIDQATFHRIFDPDRFVHAITAYCTACKVSPAALDRAKDHFALLMTPSTTLSLPRPSHSHDIFSLFSRNSKQNTNNATKRKGNSASKSKQTAQGQAIARSRLSTFHELFESHSTLVAELLLYQSLPMLLLHADALSRSDGLQSLVDTAKTFGIESALKLITHQKLDSLFRHLASESRIMHNILGSSLAQWFIQWLESFHRTQSSRIPITPLPSILHAAIDAKLPFFDAQCLQKAFSDPTDPLSSGRLSWLFLHSSDKSYNWFPGLFNLFHSQITWDHFPESLLQNKEKLPSAKVVLHKVLLSPAVDKREDAIFQLKHIQKNPLLSESWRKRRQHAAVIKSQSKKPVSAKSSTSAPPAKRIASEAYHSSAGSRRSSGHDMILDPVLSGSQSLLSPFHPPAVSSTGDERSHINDAIRKAQCDRFSHNPAQSPMFAIQSPSMGSQPTRGPLVHSSSSDGSAPHSNRSPSLLYSTSPHTYISPTVTGPHAAPISESSASHITRNAMDHGRDFHLDSKVDTTMLPHLSPYVASNFVYPQKQNNVQEPPLPFINNDSSRLPTNPLYPAHGSYSQHASTSLRQTFRETPRSAFMYQVNEVTEGHNSPHQSPPMFHQYSHPWSYMCPQNGS